MTDDELVVTLPNRLEEIPRLAELVDAFAARHGVQPEAASHVNLALDEAISNVIRHGFDDDGAHDIGVRLNVAGTSITIEVVDEGRAFNPLEAPPVDLDMSPLDREPGGLGIHLIRSLMSGVDYRRDGDRNVLTMRKDGVR